MDHMELLGAHANNRTHVCCAFFILDPVGRPTNVQAENPDVNGVSDLTIIFAVATDR